MIKNLTVAVSGSTWPTLGPAAAAVVVRDILNIGCLALVIDVNFQAATVEVEVVEATVEEVETTVEEVEVTAEVAATVASRATATKNIRD
jgi:hypothetical protein